MQVNHFTLILFCDFDAPTTDLKNFGPSIVSNAVQVKPNPE